MPQDQKYCNIQDHCHYTGKYCRTANSICSLRYKTPTETPVVFHNGFNCDYHFIIEELAEEFEGQFECLGENTKTYITFSVPIKKTENGNTIIYKLKFIDNVKFMSRAHYQLWMIIFLKLTKKINAKIASMNLDT